MFGWFKKNKTIEFYTPIKEITETEFLAPSTSKNDLIALMKRVKVQKSINSVKEVSIKNCPGIIEYMRNGFVVKAWQDIYIETDLTGDNFSWQSPVPRQFILRKDSIADVIDSEKEMGHFDRQIFFDYFPRPNTLKNVLKINTPWFIKLPPGYGALILPVWYDNETRFSVIPGILQTDYLEKLNVQIYWHSLGRGDTIKSGTPLAKIYPIKLDDKWDLVVREMNDKDYDKLNLFRTLYLTSFSDAWKTFTHRMDHLFKKLR